MKWRISDQDTVKLRRQTVMRLLWSQQYLYNKMITSYVKYIISYCVRNGFCDIILFKTVETSHPPIQTLKYFARKKFLAGALLFKNLMMQITLI